MLFRVREGGMIIKAPDRFSMPIALNACCSLSKRVFMEAIIIRGLCMNDLA